MNQKKILNLIVLLAILYFLWLFIVALNEIIRETTLLLDLKMWAIIGVVVYAIFLIIEILLYLTRTKEESREIKLVSDVETKVMCSYCKTTFMISDSGIRPIGYTCPHCGKDGALKGKKIEGTKFVISCSQCHDAFEIVDTEERPLKYECPHCHHQGDVK